MANRFFNKVVIGLIAVTSFLVSLPVLALDIIPSNSNYYYNLGGGSDISLPPVTQQTDITLGGDTNTNLGFDCNSFNPAFSLSTTLNQLKDSVEGLYGNAIGSATSAVGALPMYLLNKADPELYDTLQNALSSWADTFHIKMKDCQTALENIRQNKSPYQNWFSIADSQGWFNHAQQAKQGQHVDIITASKEITQDPKKYGIPWVHKGQNSGGTETGQVPIKVIYDVVVAGYNAMVDPDRALDSNAPAPSTSSLAKFWQTPADAGKWAQFVLGDITISAKEGQDDTHAGAGLVTLLRTCPTTVDTTMTCAGNIKSKLIPIVRSSEYPTAQQLQSVSSNEMLITPDVINSIRNRTTEEQAIAISKISEDVAIQNLVDEALLLRHILIAGSQTKPVHNLNPALTTVQRTINQLDNDIRSLKFEHDIRREFTTDTVQTILSNEGMDKLNASSQSNETQQPSMQNGAVYKE